MGDSKPDTDSPPVSALGLTNATSIALGVTHACAIVPKSTGNNALFCWGDNNASEIGEGDATTGALPTDETSPVLATQLSGVNVIAVAAGSDYTCVLVAGGTVECWGSDFFGELGNGGISTTSNPNPTAISGLTGVTQLAGGASQVCALMTGSGIKCWGTGAVGDGTTGGTGTVASALFNRCP
jgi:alpha-tubulin suppressor-like RCC1 family protein